MFSLIGCTRKPQGCAHNAGTVLCKLFKRSVSEQRYKRSVQSVRTEIYAT